MNIKKYIMLAFAVLSTGTLMAATGLESGTKFGTGEDSIRCLENISLYRGYYKIKDYNAAYESWKNVVAECPKSATRTLYAHGAVIIANKLVKEKDPVKRKEWFNKLMQCYDLRIKYFGKDRKYPKEWIIGRKAIDYINYSGIKNPTDSVLPMLKTTVDAFEHNAEQHIINAYFQLLEKQYKSNPEQYKVDFIAEYIRLSGFLDLRSAKGDKYAASYAEVKNNIDLLFTSSGAADCKTLEGVFASKVEENKANAESLGKIIKLFRRLGCTESDVYFAASLYAHKLNPTAETAAGCAFQAVKKGEFENAIKYFAEAVDLETVDLNKYDYQIAEAKMYQNIKNYPKARQAALEASKYNPNKGQPYLLIAVMYADSNPFPNDPILAKTVYWAAVDQLIKAKSVDASCAADAQQLINNFTQHYPAKEDVFFKQELEVGKPFYIGGWINETVICRD